MAVCACAALHSRHARETAPVAADAPTAQASPASAEPLLTITVTDLRNYNGDLIFSVFTQADGFPNIQAKAKYWELKPADAGGGGTVTFTVHLPAGRYAAGVLHDENRNGDMDKNMLGVPKEGYGVTNNPKPSLRKATFDEAAFTLPPEGAALTISLQYF